MASYSFEDLLDDEEAPTLSTFKSNAVTAQRALTASIKPEKIETHAWRPPTPAVGVAFSSMKSVMKKRHVASHYERSNGEHLVSEPLKQVRKTCQSLTSDIEKLDEDADHEHMRTTEAFKTSGDVHEGLNNGLNKLKNDSPDAMMNPTVIHSTQYNRCVRGCDMKKFDRNTITSSVLRPGLAPHAQTFGPLSARQDLFVEAKHNGRSASDEVSIIPVMGDAFREEPHHGIIHSASGSCSQDATSKRLGTDQQRACIVGPMAPTVLPSMNGSVQEDPDTSFSKANKLTKVLRTLVRPGVSWERRDFLTLPCSNVVDSVSESLSFPHSSACSTGKTEESKRSSDEVSLTPTRKKHILNSQSNNKDESLRIGSRAENSLKKTSSTSAAVEQLLALSVSNFALWRELEKALALVSGRRAISPFSEPIGAVRRSREFHRSKVYSSQQNLDLSPKLLESYECKQATFSVPSSQQDMNRMGLQFLNGEQSMYVPPLYQFNQTGLKTTPVISEDEFKRFSGTSSVREDSSCKMPKTFATSPDSTSHCHSSKTASSPPSSSPLRVLRSRARRRSNNDSTLFGVQNLRTAGNHALQKSTPEDYSLEKRSSRRYSLDKLSSERHSTQQHRMGEDASCCWAEIPPQYHQADCLLKLPVCGEASESPANCTCLRHKFWGSNDEILSDESGSGSVTFVVSGADADVQTNSIAQANRVSPASVQWLKDNYEPAEGVSLPRSTLYNYYIRHCADHKLDPVNAASFGKLIRSVFMGLRTRRLGTRGNSKYHYYGIRVKPSSPLFSLNDDGGQSPPHSSADSPSAKKIPGSQGNGSAGKTGVSYKDGGSYERPLPADASPQTIANQQYLGDSDMLCFPDIVWGSDPLPPGVTMTHVNTFSDLYREHCSTLQDAVHALKFSAVESIWKKFWLVGGNNNNNNNDSMDVKEPFLSHLDEDDENNLAARIPQGPLQALMRATPVLEFIQTADYALYQCLVDVLIPDVLRSIPTNLTQAIRNFAKSLEGWLSQALLGCPTQLQHLKVVAVSSLGQMLRRYTSLNHLAQAARAVLHNAEQIQQMLQDLNRVDFHNVHEQASWVCGCDEAIVSRLETDFKSTLQKPSSLEDWAKWLNKLVDDILEPHHAQRDFPLQARQFLLKWSFYSSMVIRDLTLRSAASFGSFHLIRLLYDEYMFYVVERRVANVLGRTPIAVMSEFLSARRECNDEVVSPAITNGEHHGQPLSCADSDKYEEPKLKKLKYEPA